MSAFSDVLHIGISACLIGQTVRYDGRHKFQPLIANMLSDHAELRPFCPEVAAGLGVPRPPVRLISTSSGTTARGVEDPNLDVTDRLVHASQSYCSDLDELSGFILKSRSPSCGLGSTPLYEEGDAEVRRYGNGLFAEQLHITAPWLPCVEEEWLLSAAHCRRFLTACLITAQIRYGYSADTELVEALEEAFQLAGEKLIEVLLDDDKEREQQAALDERLERYWS